MIRAWVVRRLDAYYKCKIANRVDWPTRELIRHWWDHHRSGQ